MPFIQRFVKPIYVSRAFRKDTASADDNGDNDADGASRNTTKSAYSLINNHELEHVVNNTLSNELRQLGSLLLIADSIFVDLGRELSRISQRSSSLNQKITTLQLHVENINPKNILVPAEDLCSFATRKKHYESKNQLDCCLFNARSRPKTIQDLYNAATKSPVTILQQLDRFRKANEENRLSIKAITSTASHSSRSSSSIAARRPQSVPVSGIRDGEQSTQYLSNLDIETRIPALMKHLRQWTSTEILGDLTVNINHPNQVISSSYTNYSNCDIDCSLNANFSDINLTFSRNGFICEKDRIEVCNDNGITHKLPSPEEQVQTIANKYSSKVLPIDVSGTLFNKLSEQRRSMIFNEFDYVKKQLKTRPRKYKGSRRRNTLAGTDQKELREALNAHSLFRRDRTVEKTVSGSEYLQKNSNATNRVSYRSKKQISQQQSSKSVHNEQLLRSKNAKTFVTTADRSSGSGAGAGAGGCGDRKLSHFSALKQWSRNTLRKLNRSNPNRALPVTVNENRERNETGKVSEDDESGTKRTINANQQKEQQQQKERQQQQQQRLQRQGQKGNTNCTFESPNGNVCVRLRETFSIQRRLNRLGVVSSIREEVHSSSGNWSASSESGRTSLIYDTIVRPKSTCSINSSSVASRRKFTPDLMLTPTNTATATTATSTATSEDDNLTANTDNQDFNVSENESVYSCDAEGYYTSFHLDSGLKPLKEEELVFSHRNANNECNDLNVASHVDEEADAATSTSTGTGTGTGTGTDSNHDKQHQFIANHCSYKNNPLPPPTFSETFVTIGGPSLSDNDYDIFGKESTSTTTTSSAGTVCTTLMKNGQTKNIESRSGIPSVPERKSSLKAFGKMSRNDSPDSGHNTSSSPIDSTHSLSGQRSGSELDYSESSSIEVDATERIERRIRLKTHINTTNIPSMCCAITPPPFQLQYDEIPDSERRDRPIDWSTSSSSRPQESQHSFDESVTVVEHDSACKGSLSLQNSLDVSSVGVFPNSIKSDSDSDSNSNNNSNNNNNDTKNGNFGHSTPINLEKWLRKKSSMTSEQLSTLIYQNRRKMNIQIVEDDDGGNLNGHNNTHLDKNNNSSVGSRLDASLDRGRTNSTRKFTNLDFKKLLLEQSSRQSPQWLRSQKEKSSAVEQLKLSKQTANALHSSSGDGQLPLLIESLPSSPKFFNSNRKRMMTSGAAASVATAKQNGSFAALSGYHAHNQKFDSLPSSIPEDDDCDTIDDDDHDTNNFRPTLETAL